MDHSFNIFSSDIDECGSLPCQPNGKCIDGVNSYTCQCNSGYEGKHCENSKFSYRKLGLIGLFVPHPY